MDEALLSGDMKAAVKQYKASQKQIKTCLGDADQIMQTLSRLSGIPVEKMTQADSKRYLNLEAELHKRIGQDEAVSAISHVLFVVTSQVFVLENVQLVPYVPWTYWCW